VATASQLAAPPEDNPSNGDGNDGNDETREKLQNIRVKFLRLAHRLGQSPQNVVVAQVLYRLGLAEQLRGGRSASRAGAFSFDRANAIAEEQEAVSGQEEELDFACTVLLLGKTGVGKSATINSIFDEPRTSTNAFHPSTKKVQEIVGHVHGIKVLLCTCLNHLHLIFILFVRSKSHDMDGYMCCLTASQLCHIVISIVDMMLLHGFNSKSYPVFYGFPLELQDIMSLHRQALGACGPLKPLVFPCGLP
jgi:hypothetical protein